MPISRPTTSSDSIYTRSRWSIITWSLILPALGQLCFRGRLDVKLSLLQAAIVLGLAFAEEGDRHDRQRLDATYVPRHGRCTTKPSASSRPRFAKSARRTCATSSWV